MSSVRRDPPLYSQAWKSMGDNFIPNLKAFCGCDVIMFLEFVRHEIPGILPAQPPCSKMKLLHNSCFYNELNAVGMAGLGCAVDVIWTLRALVPWTREFLPDVRENSRSRVGPWVLVI
ncbi:hypothetical protein PoB_007317500 [Plakobranchus ocellatus]|uniref:Uncharacterized protein n=1 Tax=Plakobranchus ocellatus TaxID=259542 RepID=A0AAV4DRT1_9GAST|nr:hypothetical protein PoB_007317500 [Plakobranchus ocellatus]